MRSVIAGTLVVLLAGMSQAPGQDAPLLSAPTSGRTDGPTPSSFWVEADYLLWWIKPSVLPGSLIVASNVSPDIRLIDPNATITVTPLTENRLNYGQISGMRGTVGGWLDPDNLLGVEAGFLNLNRRILTDTGSSSGLPGSIYLTRGPVFDLALAGHIAGLPFAGPTPFGGGFAGSFEVSRSSRLYGMDFNARSRLINNDSFRMEALIGFRSLTLHENLDIITTTSSIANSAPAEYGNLRLQAPYTFRVEDHYGLHTFFYGGQVGARTEYLGDLFFVQANAKFGLGTNYQIASLRGLSSATSSNTGLVQDTVGLLVTPSNRGRYTRNEFSALADMGLKVGVRITDSIRAHVGYDLLYWTNVVRPAEQVNLVVAGNEIPNKPTVPGQGGPEPRGPGFEFRSNDYFAYGVNFGLQLSF